MSTYRLEKIFAPRSIALVGASPRETSVGRKILRNLREAGFAGPLHLVNPRYPQIDGIATVARHRPVGPKRPISSSSRRRPRRFPDLVAAAGAKGCGGAVIITAGLGHGPGSLGARGCARPRARTACG